MPCYSLRMDREMMLRHLLEAERHVAQGERHVDEQRKLVEELRRDGHDIKQSLELLDTFLETLKMHKEDRDRIQAELAAIQ